MKLWQNIFLTLFTGLIFFPSAVDLAHVFSGHKHDICTHYAESHFHQKTVDCELFKFQQQVFSFPPLYSEAFVEAQILTLPPQDDYLYLSTYRKLHFSLRAPPQVV